MTLIKLRLSFLVTENVLTYWNLSDDFLTHNVNSWTLRGDL